MTLEIKYLGHSAFQFKVAGKEILVDPFLSQSPWYQGDLSEFVPEHIFVTHAHSDHLGDAIEISKRTGAIIHTIFELATYCASKGAKVNPVNVGGRLEFEWGIVTFMSAAHSSTTFDGVNGGVASSIMFRFKDKRVFHAGDTALTADLKMIGEVYKPEIVLLPIGGHYTMGIKEAVLAAKWLNAKQCIPMHYNTFPQIAVDINDFRTLLESESMIKPLILKPGEVVAHKI